VGLGLAVGTGLGLTVGTGLGDGEGIGVGDRLALGFTLGLDDGRLEAVAIEV